MKYTRRETIKLVGATVVAANIVTPLATSANAQATQIVTGPDGVHTETGSRKIVCGCEECHPELWQQ